MYAASLLCSRTSQVNFCWLYFQAFKRGWRYPQYVFIIFGWYNDNWFHPVNGDINCTISEMEQTLNLAILVSQLAEILDRSQTTESGKVYLPLIHNHIYNIAIIM